MSAACSPTTPMDESFSALGAMTRERLQDEAILLAGRVIVMSPGPGHVVADERIDLPRRRDVSSPEFNEVRRRLGALLHSDHQREDAA